MKIRAKDFFSGAEKERIRQAVEAAEDTTSGEIAIMVVPESDPYREAQLIGALSLAGLTSLVLSLGLYYVTIWFFIPVTCFLLVPSLYLFRYFPHMKLAFLHRKRIDDAVRERAVYGFFQKGAHKAEGETCIFIFISLLERRVWILGDKGIHSKIRADFWRSLTRELTDGIKGDRTLEALLSVIEKCGAELTRHFPGPTGRKKLLTDEVIF